MKKLFSLALALGLCVAANAQSETYYGAEKGGFALSIGADPVLNFVGNMFNGTENNSLEDFGGTLAGKVYLSDKFALKAELGVNNFKATDFFYAYDEDEEAYDYDEVVGKAVSGSKSFSLGLGAQYYLRPGKRLQPFIGASVYYGRTNTILSAVSDDEDIYVDAYYDGTVISAEDGYHKVSAPVNTFAVMANIGVEYFLKENISISATLDLGVGTSTYKTVSKFDMADVEKEVEELNNFNYKTGKDTFFATGLNSAIAFNFYF